MNVYTIRSKYAFGDVVKFDSKWNGSGEGKIIIIALDAVGSIYYYIETDSGDVIGGILPDDIIEEVQ